MKLRELNQMYFMSQRERAVKMLLFQGDRKQTQGGRKGRESSFDVEEIVRECKKRAVHSTTLLAKISDSYWR